MWINPRINVVWQGQWRAGHVEPVRFLPDHELIVFRVGHCIVEMQDRRLKCGPDTYLIVPPNHRHMTMAGSDAVLRYCVHFDWVSRPDDSGRASLVSNERVPWMSKTSPLAPEDLKEGPSWIPRGPMYGRISRSQEVATLIDTFMARWSSGDQINQACCQATFHEILLRLLAEPGRASAPSGRAFDLAMKAKVLLDNVQADRPNLPVVLEPLGYSYEHISRLFSITFGMTPLAYLDMQRLERAKILLRDPSVSIAAVARQSGFEDPNYFSRVFRRHAGMPPRRYSQLCGSSDDTKAPVSTEPTE